MNPTFDSRTFGLILVVAAWALFLAVIGSPEILLFTAPVFLLTAPLALGRYVGQDLVVRLARTTRPSRHGRGSGLPAGRPGIQIAVAGSLLIASNLAGRAPPAAAA